MSSPEIIVKMKGKVKHVFSGTGRYFYLLTHWLNMQSDYSSQDALFILKKGGISESLWVHPNLQKETPTPSRITRQGIQHVVWDVFNANFKQK